MNENWKPQKGGVYRCLKSSKEYSYQRGKLYVFDGDNLKSYNSRWVNLLLNGYNCLRQPGAFEPVLHCPFCTNLLFGVEGALTHDGEECAAKWDAQVKNYCRECGADLDAGKCPKCVAVGRSD